MKTLRWLIFPLACLGLLAALKAADETADKEAARKATREHLRKVLEAAAKIADVNITFQQGESQPFNFVGVINDGLKYCDSLEVVIGVTAFDTIGFRVYPHYKSGYINVDKAKNGPALMRKLLRLTDRNFLYWGIDETSDVFSGYTITLESGFPEEVVLIVLRSIRNTDGFVGELRADIDG
jgi:hypothetical protein